MKRILALAVLLLPSVVLADAPNGLEARLIVLKARLDAMTIEYNAMVALRNAGYTSLPGALPTAPAPLVFRPYIYSPIVVKDVSPPVGTPNGWPTGYVPQAPIYSPSYAAPMQTVPARFGIFRGRFLRGGCSGGAGG